MSTHDPASRAAEIAAQHVRDVDRVLHEDRLVQPVVAPHRLRLLVGDAAAAGCEVGDVGIDEVTRRQPDDDEGEDRDEQAGDQRQAEPAQQVHQHARALPVAPLAATSRFPLARPAFMRLVRNH